MTTTAQILSDMFDRVQQVVHATVGDLGDRGLRYRPDADANPAGWLIWHLSRVQDDHIAGAFGVEQVWTAADWADRFGLPYDTEATGYAQSRADVERFDADVDLVLGYYDAVHAQTARLLEPVNDTDLERIVDEDWDPPVTLGVRLVSVISDDLQHAGQAAYVAGMARRSRS